MESYDLLIIGGGPAGLAAAVYASRAMLSFAVLEQATMPGGQMMNTNEIDNYPGLPNVDGFTLSMEMKNHAEALGTTFVPASVKGLVRRDGIWEVLCDQTSYRAKTVILAAGARHKKLQVPGEAEYAGKGISYCATCDGAFYRGRITAVIGGGNTAVEDALHLANLCEKVYLIHRRDALRANGALTERLLNNPKIQVLWNTQVLSIEGEKTVTGLRLNTEETLPVDGVFVAVGITPNSDAFRDVVECDQNGFITADETGKTSAEGLFVAGDIRTKALRQVITAAADGANALAAAQRYLQGWEELGMPVSIALAGNPNCGKTTMYNALTGSSQYVGNRPGVTVEETAGELRNHKGVDLVDLPGIYSLSPYTMEEVVSRNYLIDQHPDAIINLVDASNIERNLYLTTQLWEVGFPVLVSLNMMDVAEKNGDKIDVEKLEMLLGCRVIPTSALKGEGLSELSEAAVALAKSGELPQKLCRFSPRVEAALLRIEGLIAPAAEELHLRWFVIKVFERDERVRNRLDLSDKVWEEIEAVIAACEKDYDDESDSIIINQRYEYITGIVERCVVRHKIGTTASDKVDNVMTNRYLALPLFVLIMCAVYYISIQSVGAWATAWMEGLVENLCVSVAALLTGLHAADWLIGLIVDGFISGVGAVICFVPQLAILFLFLALLEDCGYMARIAFIMDRVFRRFGLSGKSFIPLLVSSGCGVPGIMSCRTIESEKDRKITIMVTTFVPCGAKLPVISLIAGSLFRQSAWVAISVYFLGILMVFLSGVILKKLRSLASDPAPFVMEMPSYHLPNVRNVLKHVWDDVRAFLVKAGTIIFLACGIIWFLSNFAWNLQMTDTSHSILASIGGVLAPIFRPLGFGQWQTAVAALTGMAAKENIVSSLNVLYGLEKGKELGSLLTPLSGYSFLIFNMLCSPCVAAIGAIRREMNDLRWTWFALGYQTALAYGVTLVIYQFGSFFLGGGFTVGTATAVAILGFSLYLLLRKRK